MPASPPPWSQQLLRRACIFSRAPARPRSCGRAGADTVIEQRDKQAWQSVDGSGCFLEHFLRGHTARGGQERVQNDVDKAVNKKRGLGMGG